MQFHRKTVLLLLTASVASADPVISEFMASNQNSISDEDGFKADWIEIHNPDAAPVNLDGWSLTDKAAEPRQWIFPAVTIPANGQLIVYASNKNRRIPGQPLHTNFALSAGGEYLALIKPDGITKSTEFSPGFPPQFGDISYGTAGAITRQILVDLGSPVKAKVPLDGNDGTAWRNLVFNDSAWLTGTLAAGYFNYNGSSAIDLTDRLGLDLSAQMGGKATSAYLRIPFNVAHAADITSLKLRMNYDDGFVAFINGATLASGTAPAVGTLAYNSQPTGLHSPFETAGSYEETDVTASVGQLVDGANLLAIHALNGGNNSSDLFIDAQLVAGINTGAGTETGYFNTATPGAANGGPETFQLPQTVTYSKASGPFTTSFQVTLTGAAAGQQIRYLIADPSGSPNANIPAPSVTSTLYTGPITISSSKVIRAAVFDPVNSRGGAPKTVQYLLLEPGATNNSSAFTSQLPIAVIDQHGGGGYNPGEPYKPSFFYLFDRVAGTASLNSTPNLFSKIQNKVRGSSSAHFPKRAYGMKTSDESGANEKKSLLGLAADSSWVWYNPWKYDDSYVRNQFMFQLSRDIGRWASRTRPVEMFLNVNGGRLDYSDYHGIYVLTEKIESGSGRLDISSIGSSDVSGDALTGAYIIKIDRADADETSWTTPMAQAGGEDKIVLVEPEQEDEKPEQVAYIKNYINRFETALAADRAGNWQTRNYRKYIDVPSWIDVHLLNSFSLNPDAFRLSSYFHKDRNEKLKAGPIWDFDRALSADKDNGETPDTPRQWNGTHFDMSWWREVFRDPEFIQAWVDRWWEIRGGALSDHHLASLITAMGDEIGNAAGARDAARWPGVDGNAPESGSYLGEIAALRDWLSSSTPGNLGRANWIDTQVPGPPSASLASGKVAAGTTITLGGAGSGETIRYRTNGLDPRPPGGADSNASTYSTALAINQTTVVKARRRKASNFVPFPHDLTTTWSAPLTRVYLVNEDFATAADLTVSEIHYDPAAPTPAELAAGMEVTAGKFEYIELRNTGSRSVNTFEIQFADGLPFKQLILSPLTLQPGEFALVVKNRDAFLSRFGGDLAPKIVGEWSDGSLSNSGGQIKILARDGGTLYDAGYSPNAANGASLVNVGGGWKADVPSPGKLGPGYAEWKAFYFPNGGDDLADPDSDGAGNLLEYGRGTNPLVAENQIPKLPTFTLAAGNTSSTYNFALPIDRPGASYQVEMSTDLAIWSPVASTPVSTAAGMENRQVTLPAGPGKKFLRLRTTASP